MSINFVGNTNERARDCNTCIINTKEHKGIILFEGSIASSGFSVKASKMEEALIFFNYKPTSLDLEKNRGGDLFRYIGIYGN